MNGHLIEPQCSVITSLSIYSIMQKHPMWCKNKLTAPVWTAFGPTEYPAKMNADVIVYITHIHIYVYIIYIAGNFRMVQIFMVLQID